MTQHTDLIDRLRASSEDGLTPDDAYAAAEALEAQSREIAGLRAARMAYASEFPLDGEGEPDVGSIHQNIRAMKAEIERLRKDAALVAARERERMDKDAQRWAMAVQIINGVIFHPSRDDESHAANAYRLAAIRGCSFTESIDAAIRALNTEGEGNDR